jgi:hypothetical protein
MMYGLNEFQIVELVLMVIVSGLLIGTFIGLLVRSLYRFIY